MAQTKTSPLGVLLMSFGSAATADEVPGYLTRVRGGKPAPDDLIAEFQRRYKLIGGSPLRRITAEQGAALETLLNKNTFSSQSYHVAVGMQYSEPSIESGLRQLTEAGIRRIVGIIMSPQYSPFFMGGYGRAIEKAKPALPAGTIITIAGAWHDLLEFINALVTRLRQTLERFPAAERDHIPIIMTVHSLPKRMVEGEPDYLRQLKATADAVAKCAGLAPDRWHFAYQSAGHTPEEWLKPDFKEMLPGFRSTGHKSVIVVPVQFLADHLETLYDIDVAGKEEAGSASMALARIPSLNTMPEFIQTLAAVVKRELATAPAPA